MYTTQISTVISQAQMPECSYIYNSDQCNYFTGADAGVYSSHVYNSDQYNYCTGPDAGV